MQKLLLCGTLCLVLNACSAISIATFVADGTLYAATGKTAVMHVVDAGKETFHGYDIQPIPEWSSLDENISDEIENSPELF